VTLLIDPAAVIIPAKGWLYIFNRKGLTKIQARQIDEVHDRLKHYLNGQYKKEDLLSAVSPEKRSAIEKYLEAIAEADGFLQPGQADREQYPANQEKIPDFRSRSQLFTFYGKRVFVSCHGHQEDPHQPECDLRFAFCTPAQMDAAWSGIWRQGTKGPHLIYVIAQDSTALRWAVDGEVVGDGQLLAWLLATVRSESWNGRKLRVYSLDADSGLTLRFEGAFTHQPEKKHLVPDFVRMTQDDQIPLVVAQASLPFYATSVTGCGIQYDLLQEELRRELVVRGVLAASGESAKHAFVTERTGGNGSNPRLRRARIRLPESHLWPIAASLLEARAGALERFCWSLSEPYSDTGRREADLLQPGQPHPHIAHLTDILRTRLRTLIVNIRSTVCGLHVCQSQGRIAYSFIESKAIRDLLIMVTKDTFYGDSLPAVPPKHDCDFATFLNEDELRRLVGDREKTLNEMHIDRSFTFRHVEQFGISAWIGHFHDANEDPDIVIR